MFKTMLAENIELLDEKISELVNAFMNALTVMLKKTVADCIKANIDNRMTARY